LFFLRSLCWRSREDQFGPRRRRRGGAGVAGVARRRCGADAGDGRFFVALVRIVLQFQPRFAQRFGEMVVHWSGEKKQNNKQIWRSNNGRYHQPTTRINREKDASFQKRYPRSASSIDYGCKRPWKNRLLRKKDVDRSIIEMISLKEKKTKKK